MSLERLTKGSNVKTKSADDPIQVPSWMDEDRFRRGQEFFQRHLTSVFFAVHCSLTVAFAISNFVQVVVFTKKSDTPPKARHRYVKTLAHVVLWHTQDVWKQNTLANRSIKMVRRMHDHVTEAMESQGNSKRLISQLDMAVVQSVFMGAVIMYPSSFGIACRREELEDYIFFWRGIGHLLGMEDEYNLCSGNFEETYTLCKDIERHVVYGGLLDPPKEFDALANAYINGMNSIFKFRFNTVQSVIYFVLNASQRTLPFQKFSLSDKIRALSLRVIAFLLRWVPGFERLLNRLLMDQFSRMTPVLDQEIARNV